jgi:hypothetical protein
MSFSSKDVLHRRCDDPSKAVGASYGGGQKVPGMLLQCTINAAVFASLLSNSEIIRIAGFGSGE